MKEIFQLLVTEYSGEEDSILQVRNRNRQQKQTRSYLDWRYHGPPNASSPNPIIFWLQKNDGQKIGMASLIFRQYIMRDKINFFGVLGDISIDQKYRGKKLGQKLLNYATSYIDSNVSNICLVIPNKIAGKALSKAGWRLEDYRTRYVLILDSSKIFLKITRIQWFSRLVSSFISRLVKIILVKNLSPHYSIKYVDEINESFDILWQKLNKKNLIISQKSSENLQWRYNHHPSVNFKIAKFFSKNQFIGYVVFSGATTKTSCKIYDIIFLDEHHFIPSLSAFCLDIRDKVKVPQIVVTLNKKHPYSSKLRKCLFIRRQDNDIIQTYNNPKSRAAQLVWMISDCDKDV